MKLYVSFLIFWVLSAPVFSQGKIIGNVFYQSSNFTPVEGVRINAKGSNGAYSKNEGAFTLEFPHDIPGNTISPTIGTKKNNFATLRNGKDIELVNVEKLKNISIPKNPAEAPLKIIVCLKGARNFAARKYYKILKSSSELEVTKTKKELEALLKERKKDYKEIARLSDQVSSLEEKIDSVSLYKEAFGIASINKDGASKRVLHFLELLDQGSSVQEARQALSLKKASKELHQSLQIFDHAINEIETRATASSSIFDYKDAIACYDTIIHYVEKRGINPLKLAEYYFKISSEYLSFGDYKQMLKYSEMALEIREERLDSLDLDLAKSCKQVGLSLLDLGVRRYEEAKILLEKALKIEEEVYGKSSSKLNTTYNNLGGYYYNMGYKRKALECMQKGLSLLERDSNQSDRAGFYNNIAALLGELGDKDQALELQQKAVAIREAIKKPNSLSLAGAYSGMGGVYFARGENRKALEWFNKCLRIEEKIYHENHRNLAGSYTYVGKIYLKMKNYKQALFYQQKCLNIRENIMEESNPEIATVYFKIAEVYRDSGLLDLAIDFAQKGIDKLNKSPEPFQIILAEGYQNLGKTYLKLKQYQGALDYFLPADSLFKASKEHQLNYQYYLFSEIADTYEGLQQFTKALDYRIKAQTSYENDHINISENLAQIYYRTGITYNLLKNKEQAIFYFEKALQIEKELKIENQNHIIVLGFIGSRYYELENYAQSMLYYDEAIEAQKRIEPDNYERRKEYYEVKINLCSLTNDTANMHSTQLDLLPILIKLLGDQHIEVATLCNKIGNNIYTDKNYETAADYFIKAADIQALQKDPNLADWLIYLNNAATSFNAAKKSEEELPYRTKAIEVLKRIEPIDTLKLKELYEHRIKLYSLKNDIPKILLDQLDLVPLQQKLLGEQHIELATLYNKIGNNYFKNKNYETAADYFIKAADIQALQKDPNLTDWLIYLNNAATSFNTAKKPEEELPYRTKAIEVLKRIEPIDTLKLKELYEHRIKLYSLKNDIPKILLDQLDLLPLQQKLLGENHADVALLHNKIGNNYYVSRNYVEAAVYFEKAAEIQLQLKDPLLSNLLIYYNNTALAYEGSGNLDKELLFRTKAIQLQEQLKTWDAKTKMEAYRKIVVLHKELKTFDDAISYQNKLLPILKKEMETDSIYQKEFTFLLELHGSSGLAAFHNKNYQKARDHFLIINEQFDHAEVLKYTALAHYYLEAYEKAIEIYNKRKNAFPEVLSLHHYNNIGTAYLKNKQFEEAKHAFTEYEKLYPKEGRTYRNWGMYHAMLANKDQAILMLQKAIDLDFHDLDWFENDSSLNAIRKEKAFVKMLDQLKAKIKQKQ